MSSFTSPVNPLLFGFIDNSNLSTEPLDAGASYTGAIRNVTYYNKVIVTVISDQAGTLYIDQYFDITAAPIITTTVVYGGGIASVTNQQFSLPFYRIRYTNGGVAQTTFLVTSKVCVYQ